MLKYGTNLCKVITHLENFGIMVTLTSVAAVRLNIAANASNVLQAIVFMYRQDDYAVCAEKIAFEEVATVGNLRRNENLEVSNDDLLSQRYW
ncbi:MAG: hypothetical protein RL368_346 [Pseudomonadota bacterium]